MNPTPLSILRKTKEAVRLLAKGELFQIAIRSSGVCLPPEWALLGKSYLIIVRWPMPVGASLGGEFLVRRGTIDDIPGMVACSGEPGDEDSAAFYRALFSDGQLCSVAHAGPRVVGYCWAFFDKYTLTYDGYKRSRIHLGLNRNEAFLGNGFVAADCRRRGLYAHVLRALTDDVHASRGITDFLGAVNANNDVARAAQRRLGFVEFCAVYYCKIYPAQLVVVVPRRRRPRLFVIGHTSTIDCRSLYC
jgi:ribosomal protein S18 acetylase RimI-like enzyme